MNYSCLWNMKNYFIITRVIKAFKIQNEEDIKFCIMKLNEVKESIKDNIKELNITEAKYENDVEIILNGTLFFIIYIKYFKKIRYKLLIETFQNSIYSKFLLKSELKKYNSILNTNIHHNDLFVSDGKELLLPLTIYIHFIKAFHIYEFKKNDDDCHIVVIKHLQKNFGTEIIKKTKMNKYYLSLFFSKYRSFYDVLVNIIYEKILITDLFCQHHSQGYY